MAIYGSEVINTKHWIPTGIFRLCKKTGKMKEVKRPVVHRRLFMTVTGATPINLVANIRIVRIARSYKVKDGLKKDDNGNQVYKLNGEPEYNLKKVSEVIYSLSGRKEKGRNWWEKDATGKPLPPEVAAKYTKIGDSMTRLEAIHFLSVHIDNASVVLDELDNGEPMEGDEGRSALLRYGYEEFEWVEDKAA